MKSWGCPALWQRATFRYVFLKFTRPHSVELFHSSHIVSQCVPRSQTRVWMSSASGHFFLNLVICTRVELLLLCLSSLAVLSASSLINANVPSFLDLKKSFWNVEARLSHYSTVPNVWMKCCTTLSISILQWFGFLK